MPYFQYFSQTTAFLPDCFRRKPIVLLLRFFQTDIIFIHKFEKFRSRAFADFLEMKDDCCLARIEIVVRRGSRGSTTNNANAFVCVLTNEKHYVRLRLYPHKRKVLCINPPSQYHKQKKARPKPDLSVTTTGIEPISRV